MERIIGFFIICFGFAAYAAALIADKKQKKYNELFAAQHDRKVVLGKNEQNWDEDIKEECFHDDEFFLLDNCGTCDVSYLDNYDYIAIISIEDDMFLED